MQVTINGNEHRISFRYYKNDPAPRLPKKMSGRLYLPSEDAQAIDNLAWANLRRASWNVSYATVALIEHKVDDRWEVCTNGVAFCCREDNYDREFGRVLALKRALARDRKFGRSERTQVWTAWNNRRNQSKAKGAQQ